MIDRRTLDGILLVATAAACLFSRWQWADATSLVAPLRLSGPVLLGASLSRRSQPEPRTPQAVHIQPNADGGITAVGRHSQHPQWHCTRTGILRRFTRR
jgi:hypothetical protein